MNEKRLTFSLLLVVLALGALYISARPDKILSLSEYAAQVMQKCSEKRYKPACYDEEIPKLMDDISMEDAFKVTSLVQKLDGDYLYCHVLGHNLSAREVEKDPDDWKDVVARCPSGMCSNGCIHGGFQERFRAESFTPEQIEALVPELQTLCEPREGWTPTGLEQASCYHALGHLTMYLTAADIPQSITLCERVANRFLQICYDGVFMQIFQPLEPDDFALIAGKEVKKEELADFCAQFDGKKKSSCWSEGWPLYREELKTPQGLVDYCTSSSTNDPNRCFMSLIYVMTAQFHLEEERIHDYCSDLPSNRQASCFSNGASRMVETDYALASRAVSLCTSAERLGWGDECFGELLKYSSYNYHVGSEAFLGLCRSLPPDWQRKCLNNEKI